MKLASIVFAFAAAGGLVLASVRIVGSENPPAWMALAHGVVAATALAALVIAAVRVGLPTAARVALGVFIVTALAGAYLYIGYHEAGLLLPIPLVLLHGSLAVAGLGLLLAAWLGQRTLTPLSTNRGRGEAK